MLIACATMGCLGWLLPAAPAQGPVLRIREKEHRLSVRVSDTPVPFPELWYQYRDEHGSWNSKEEVKVCTGDSEGNLVVPDFADGERVPYSIHVRKRGYFGQVLFLRTIQSRMRFRRSPTGLEPVAAFAEMEVILPRALSNAAALSIEGMTAADPSLPRGPGSLFGYPVAYPVVEDRSLDSTQTRLRIECGLREDTVAIIVRQYGKESGDPFLAVGWSLFAPVSRSQATLKLPTLRLDRSRVEINVLDEEGRPQRDVRFGLSLRRKELLQSSLEAPWAVALMSRYGEHWFHALGQVSDAKIFSAPAGRVVLYHDVELPIEGEAKLVLRLTTTTTSGEEVQRTFELTSSNQTIDWTPGR